MGQQEQCNDMAEPELPARHGRMAPWLRRIAACALALTIGLGQAYADEVTSGHEGGQGRDKSSAFATGEAFAGDGTAHASSYRQVGGVRRRGGGDRQAKRGRSSQGHRHGRHRGRRRRHQRLDPHRHAHQGQQPLRQQRDALAELRDRRGRATARSPRRSPRRARPTTSPPCATAPAASPPRPASTSPATASPAPTPAAPSASRRGGVKVETWGRTSAEVF